ncbi:hypothetical protein F5144DRAFT_589570 [Chaetomium tenue]|uniref:Uncharacterized protein n=1 Tax=Chaetomium tenue TaxID=1854479 RepID=A0ACB7PQY8_9PEZI|nr:hypothetical protein F5144DRAFT_589570 [Chaetomium globosum]
MEHLLYELTQEGLAALRRRTPYTVVDLYQLFRLVLGGNIAPLKAQIHKLAAGPQICNEMMLYHARDREGRNVFHYAAISQDRKILAFLLSPAVLSDPRARIKSKRIALLTRETERGENTALYAILQRCPPDFLDRIVSAAGISILMTTTANGLGPVHCAAMADAPDFIIHLVAKYKLDPTEPVTREPRPQDPPCFFPRPVPGDTPMHLATRHNCAGAFTALYEELGLAMDSPRNAEGRSPFEIAVRGNAKAVLGVFGLRKAVRGVPFVKRNRSVQWKPEKRGAAEMS